MARPLRITYQGAVHHVTVRGNNRSKIFKSDGDRERFINKLAESCRLYEVQLYLFCLMTNHVHLVLSTPKGNLSQFMHRLQTAYTVYFNRRHNQSGHLFQGRFGSTVVEEDEYILKLSRYVHLNPVYTKAHRDKSVRERVEILRNYTWSSYRSYIGLDERLDYIDYNPVLTMMGSSSKKHNSQYRRFVEGGIKDIDAAFIEAKQNARFGIGTSDFQERIQARYESLVQDYDKKEDVSFRQTNDGVSTKEVLEVVLKALQVQPNAIQRRGMNSMVRPVVAYSLCQYAGLTQRQVAEAMGLRSGAAVSIQIKKVHKQLDSDEDLNATLVKIKSKLNDR